MRIEGWQFVEQQIGQLEQEIASLLQRHQDAVERLAAVPGLGVDSAQQIIAEVGAKAATFPSAEKLSSWVGACPGEEESAGVNRSRHSPKGNRQMRRVLNQAANAAVKHKGSIFEIVYRRLVPRLGHNKTIGVIAHRLCHLIWIILHRGVRYEERGRSGIECLRKGGVLSAAGARETGSRGRAFFPWPSIGFLNRARFIPFQMHASPPFICDKNRM